MHQQMRRYDLNTPDLDIGRDPLILALLKRRRVLLYTSAQVADGLVQSLREHGVFAWRMQTDNQDSAIENMTKLDQGVTVTTLPYATGFRVPVDLIVFVNLVFNPARPSDWLQARGRSSLASVTVLYVNCEWEPKRVENGPPPKQG